MSSSKHALLMIPGPTEFSEEVLRAMATPGTSHVDPVFIDAFGRVLDALPSVFQVAPSDPCLPLVLAGSGTLGWDAVAANLCQPGDRALVINTGYFGDSFGDCLGAYGVTVSHLSPPSIGAVPSLDQLRAIISSSSPTLPFKVITITHVDTSTGVRAPIDQYARLIRELSPSSLIVVDGVCSIAAEHLPMTLWDIDVAFTGSQKALGVPPGLLVAMFRQRALEVFRNRTAPVSGYYVSLANWTPIVEAYRARRPSYFATPPVQLIFALEASIRSRLLASEGGVADRIAQNQRAAASFRAAVAALGLVLVAADPDANAANTLSAIRFPSGVDGPKLLGSMKAKGIVIAGGLHKQIKTEYFRIGHMGISVDTPDHLRTTLEALEQSLIEQGFIQTGGVAISTFDKTWTSYSHVSSNL